jgi:hypothetical protein
MSFMALLSRGIAYAYDHHDDISSAAKVLSRKIAEVRTCAECAWTAAPKVCLCSSKRMLGSLEERPETENIGGLKEFVRV